LEISLFVNVWLELLTMFSSTIPTELIDAIIDQVALLTPANNEPGLKASTLSSCALISRAFVFHSQKHIFHTIDLVSGVYYARFHHLLLSNPYLGTHVRRLRLIGDFEDDFSNVISSLTHLRNLRSFGLRFAPGPRAEWGSVPDEARAAFDRVFRMESVKEVELESVFCFPVASLVSLARLKYLALGNVDLDIDEGIQDHQSNSNPQREVALEGLYLRGVSPGVIKTLTKTLRNSADTPPILRKLALTQTFREAFAEVVMELITTCGSHLTSFAWLPSIYSRESTLIECRPTTDKYSSFSPRSNQHIHAPPPPLSPLPHHLSIPKLLPKSILPNTGSTKANLRSQHPRKNHTQMLLLQ
jgi:hypothetical protein